MSLFDRIVEASRLGPMLAPFTMTRLLVKANVAPDRVTPTQLGQALPTIREGLSVYLSAEDLDAAMRDISALADDPNGLRAVS